VKMKSFSIDNTQHLTPNTQKGFLRASVVKKGPCNDLFALDLMFPICYNADETPRWAAQGLLTPPGAPARRPAFSHRSPLS
jgi:hypothetical protein